LKSARRRKVVVASAGLLVLAGVIGCCLLLAGCVSPAYKKDRIADFRDIFTVTAGYGAGVRARVGPLHAGLHLGADAVGLRGGEWNVSNAMGGEDWDIWAWDFDALLFSKEGFHDWGSGDVFGRGKEFRATGGPLVIVPRRATDAQCVKPYYYYTQVEVSGGLLVNLRLGVNLGELLDFFLGWLRVDILNDDRAEHPLQTTEANIRHDG